MVETLRDTLLFIHPPKYTGIVWRFNRNLIAVNRASPAAPRAKLLDNFRLGAKSDTAKVRLLECVDKCLSELCNNSAAAPLFVHLCLQPTNPNQIFRTFGDEKHSVRVRASFTFGALVVSAIRLFLSVSKNEFSLRWNDTFATCYHFFDISERF